jgi:MraZ protein
MFLGTYEPNLMEKGRIALPKKIREELGGSRLVLTIGFETCILGFTEKSWEAQTELILTKSVFSDQEARDLRRKIFANAEVIELDSQGRFIIPMRMAQYAELHTNICISGEGDHFEIWNKMRWEEYSKELTNQ